MKYLWIFLVLFLSFPCLAEKDTNLENLGTFGDWTAYTYHDEMEHLCYMASQPIKSSGKYAKRDDVFLMVTHRPNEKAFNVVSMVAGYVYRSGSHPTLNIDKQKSVALSVQRDTAWAKDSKTDNQLVKQMRSGSTAIIRGTSKRGTVTTDTFSLKGFSKAYQTISEACNYQ